MNICYLSGGKNVPSVRFRLPFFQRLRAKGHEYRVFHAYPSRYDYYPLVGWRASQLIRKALRRWHQLRLRVESYDVVVLETGLFHTEDYSYEKRVRRVSKRMVYEIDDAVFLLFPEKCEAIARMADQIIAGNESIAGWARQFNSSVSVVPTCVDESIYRPKQYNASQNRTRQIVGWIGSSGNVAMLRFVATALQRLSRKLDFELRVITSINHGIGELDLSGIHVTTIDIDRCDIVTELQKFDIGIMPLDVGDPWMRYKCNAKMIQYMAVGVPSVGSAFGFNLELISHGQNGMLAEGDQQWEECLQQLLVSSSLRKNLGEAGHRTFLKAFSVQSQIGAFESSLMGSSKTNACR